MTKLIVDNHIETVLRKRFSRVQILESRSIEGEERFLLRRRDFVDALRFLTSDPDTQIDVLVDLSAIQHLENGTSCIYSTLVAPPFFEVFYLLRSTRLKYRVRMSVMIPEELPSLPTISGIFKNANWLERELWDLFGIFVEGHPHLRRLILYAPFEGHPLQKSYESNHVQPLVPMRSRA